jgi:hypothetical protein
MVNGFQMVNKLATQHPRFGLFRFAPHIGAASDDIEYHSRPLLAALETNDAKALRGVFARVTSERDATVSLVESIGDTAPTGAVAQHSEPSHIVWSPTDDMPTEIPRPDHSAASSEPMCMTGDNVAYKAEVRDASSLDAHETGDDLSTEGDEQRALLTAATAYLAAILYARHASTGHAHAQPPVLSRADVREAQLAHPATAQYIDHLRVGRALDDGDDSTDAFFKETAACPGRVLQRWLRRSV